MPQSLRGTSRYNPNALAKVQPAESVIVQPIPTFGFKGEDKTLPLLSLPEGVSRLVRDLRLLFGAYQTRDATASIGTAASDLIVHALEAMISTSPDTSYPTRFTAAKVQVYANGVWTDTTGTAWATTNIKPFSATGWGDTIVFAEDSLGIYSLSYVAPYPKTVLYALAGVIHLATFDKRIIASLPDRIQWCVKGNNADWTGIGSGYEDLQSSPGGRPDSQTAVVPVSDQTAIVVRTQSFWQMTSTGDFDAPYTFSTLYQGQGSRYPRTCVSIPKGVMCLGDGSVWKLTLDGGLVDVGVPIYSDLISTPQLLRLSTAAYDARLNEYRLSIPAPNSPTTGRVFRYNIDGGFWTEDLYPFPVRSISYALYSQGLSIDDLPGTIDNLQGAIDDLITGVRRSQMLFAMNDPRRYVVQESYTHNNDSNRDVQYDGTRVAGAFRIETAPVTRGSILDRAEVIQLQLEYESQGDTTISFGYSDDGGATWNTITSENVTTTTQPNLISVDFSYERAVICFAAWCSQTPQVRLINLIALTSVAGRKVDAD